MSRGASFPNCGPPRVWTVAVALVALAAAGPAVMAQWVVFQEQTGSRVSATSNLVVTDPNEKAYAWGDVDRDGDLDLAISRKEPFTTAGKRINILLVNQSGVLTDRTIDFASDSDVSGDQGFMTPTNDRDVILVDVNLDGWLDMITTAAISGPDPKHIGYPRVYKNKCCAVGGCAATSCSTANWLGFRYEDARIPVMLTDSLASGFNPCFCAVAAGDVTGDGYPDLYFSDYDTSCGGAEADFNDKLLINKGAAAPGFFEDKTETNFIGGAAGFPVSGFGASGGIAKFNQDGHNDILKQSAGFVGLAFNKPTDLGKFDKSNSPIGGATYFVAHGDLNNDGKMDLVTADDGQDRYLLNQGDGSDQMADFISFAYSYKHTGSGGNSSDDGFGGNAVVADLNKDGFNDVLITDNDVDVGGCGRRMHIFRNLGGAAGSSVTIQEQTTGSGCMTFEGNPASCLVASIPSNKLEGTHDVAVFDINGDTYKDLVVGRCSGTEVYMNVPPVPPAGEVPDGGGPGQGLMVDRSGNQIILTWSASCLPTDADYSVYQGSIGGNFQDHAPVTCSTNGATTITLDLGPGPANSYFLVAPRNEVFTGSLGTNSAGQPRHAGTQPCAPQSFANCQ